MSGYMRSEEMSYLQLLLPVEAAHSFVNELGFTGSMQFVDLNEGVQAFHRRYMRDIVRISDIERKVKLIEGFLTNHEIEYDDYIADNMIQKAPVERDVVDRLEHEIGDIYKGLTGDIKVEDELTRDLHKEEDFEEVLNNTNQFLGHQQMAEAALNEQKMEQIQHTPDPEEGNDVPLLRVDSPSRFKDDEKGAAVAFKYFAGVVTDVQRPSFERQVYLAARGNTYSLFNDIDGKQKATFVIFFLGEHLSEKLDRLCKFMGISVFLTSANSKDIDGQLKECRQHQTDVSQLLDETKRGLFRNLYKVAGAIIDWKLTLMQQKSAFETLNRFKDSERANILIAEGWCPKNQKHIVEDSLDKATQGNGDSPHVLSELAWKGKPPTHFPSNKFTCNYQLIVDTYGVPRYGEVNPAIFSIVTFPFLFAVMYGDVFHGSCITLFAILLIMKEKQLGMKKLDEFLGACYQGRYVLLLMGFFAIYCGMIYNDMMSLPLHWFRSGWLYSDIHGSDAENGTGVTINNGFPTADGGPNSFVAQDATVYPFGMDYAWYGSTQQLAFFNGFKMKAAVLFGVSQMIFGLFLGLSNHIHFKDQISIWFEFVPQFIFIISTFGYMCFLILYKWWINWGCRSPTDLQPPNIIGVMIDFVLSPGQLKPAAQIFPDKDFQIVLELVLLIAAVVSVPWMLLPKPILLARKYDRQKQISEYENADKFAKTVPHNEMVNMSGSVNETEDDTNSKKHMYSTSTSSSEKDSVSEHDNGVAGDMETTPRKKTVHDDDEEHVTFGELFIHQIIHTIEYVLGTISNTASYLRLWALSLAHAELSEVIFEQIMLRFFTSSPGFLTTLEIWFGAPAFFAVTFAVLLTMDVLECFLHALRLHWVEWQNKFYFADGIPFTPFSYKAVLAEERGD